MGHPTHALDVLIAGAGVIGLSLALELRRRGANVIVLERGTALQGASTAAAGMLAADDPHNPAALTSLSRFSLSLYPAYLSHIQELSGCPVPFQTEITVQYRSSGDTQVLPEHSVDPRQLAAALLSAVRAAGIGIVEQAAVLAVRSPGKSVELQTAEGGILTADQFIQTTGAWNLYGQELNFPRKGQMLRVVMPADAPLQEVHRAEHVYVVPRRSGPQAGTALIGATVEDAGFDLSTNPRQLQELRAAAAALAPETAFAAHAGLIEAWAGLRPSTSDGLPLLGLLRPHEWIAAGHFRNGILLAPGTARILADLLTGISSPVDLTAFDPSRFPRLPDRP